MSDRDRAWDAEHHRAALQIITEADRGMKVAEQQLKAGRLMDARETVRIVRGLLPPLERVIQRRPVRAEDATMGDPTPEELAELLAAAEERDEIAGRLAHLLCDLTGGRMSKTSYPVPVMEQEIERYLSECHESDLKDERDALAEWRDFSEAELDALRATLEGRCLSDITHRDEEHRQSVCMLPEGHAPLAHDDCMGCTWTDADHWQPSAVDRVADEVQRIADESKHEGWDGPPVRILVGRVGAAIDGDCHE